MSLILKSRLLILFKNLVPDWRPSTITTPNIRKERKVQAATTIIMWAPISRRLPGTKLNIVELTTDQALWPIWREVSGYRSRNRALTISRIQGTTISISIRTKSTVLRAPCKTSQARNTSSTSIIRSLISRNFSGPWLIMKMRKTQQSSQQYCPKTIRMMPIIGISNMIFSKMTLVSKGFWQESEELSLPVRRQISTAVLASQGATWNSALLARNRPKNKFSGTPSKASPN